MTAVAGVVPEAEGAEVPSPEEMLAGALEANRQLSELALGFLDELTEMRALVARLLERDAEREELLAQLTVLQKIVFGRKSEKSRPGPEPEPGGGDDDGDGKPAGKKKDVKRGPGARAGRRDYSHLPKTEVIWGFPGGGYCCPECGEPFTLLGTHLSGEQLDWKVLVTIVANCRRRYEKECSCPGQETVMAPGPPKAIGKGRFTNGFLAMLLTERYAAGRSMNSLVTGLARQGAEISPATSAGTCAQAGKLLAPLSGAIAERNRDSWLLYADETTWRVFAPGDGDGPARFWLWVFSAP